MPGEGPGKETGETACPSPRAVQSVWSGLSRRVPSPTALPRRLNLAPNGSQRHVGRVCHFPPPLHHQLPLRIPPIPLPLLPCPIIPLPQPHASMPLPPRVNCTRARNGVCEGTGGGDEEVGVRVEEDGRGLWLASGREPK